MSLTAQDLEALLHEGMRASREAQQAERAAQGKDKRTGPYITDLGADCDLKLIRSFRDEPSEPMDAAGEFTVNMGHALEEVIAKWLGAVDVKFLREVRLEIPVGAGDVAANVAGTPEAAPSPIVVSGRIDYILLADDTLVELKAKGWSGFSYALDRGELPSKQHRAQVNGYLHATHLGALSYEDPEKDDCSTCGHASASHIYGTGKCRPGFVCESGEHDFSGRVVVPPQDKGVILYAGFPPHYDDKNYKRPFAAFDVTYNPEVAEQQLRYVADLWRASRTHLPSEDLAPRKKSADYFPCASIGKKTKSHKAWCAFYEACWGQR